LYGSIAETVGFAATMLQVSKKKDFVPQWSEEQAKELLAVEAMQGSIL